MKKLLLITAVIFQSYFALGATWLGLIDSDWSKVGNWDGPVPGVGDDVVIPDCSGGNCPVIDGIAASTKKLTIDENATLTLSGNSTLSSVDEVLINGGFTVDPGSTLDASKSVEVGKDNDNATFENNGNVTIADDLKAEGSSGGMYDGPFITNSGDMDVSGDLNLGNDDGAGTLTNSGTMSMIHTFMVPSSTQAQWDLLLKCFYMGQCWKEVVLLTLLV
tara:strand:+ start:39 stop:695 length:657 start_codon:yes stop_codon:yes gene_type:complete